jgi:hypothetical protein
MNKIVINKYQQISWKKCNDYEWLLLQPAEREGEEYKKKTWRDNINLMWDKYQRYIWYPDTYYNVIIQPGKKALQLREIILSFLGQHPPHGIEHPSR